MPLRSLLAIDHHATNLGTGARLDPDQRAFGGDIADAQHRLSSPRHRAMLKAGTKHAGVNRAAGPRSQMQGGLEHRPMARSVSGCPGCRPYAKSWRPRLHCQSKTRRFSSSIDGCVACPQPRKARRKTAGVDPNLALKQRPK